MDRGTKDESFVRKALEVATNEDGRWVANQAFFNKMDGDPLDSQAHAAVVTAVAIYVQKYNWPEESVERAIQAKTCGEMRALIDELKPLLG